MLGLSTCKSFQLYTSCIGIPIFREQGQPLEKTQKIVYTEQKGEKNNMAENLENRNSQLCGGG